MLCFCLISQLQPLPKEKRLWHLRPQWLQSPKFLGYVGQNIASVRWEAFKTLIGGQMMGYTSKQYLEMLVLERDIQELELEVTDDNSRGKQQK